MKRQSLKKKANNGSDIRPACLILTRAIEVKSGIDSVAMDPKLQAILAKRRVAADEPHDAGKFVLS